MEWSTDTDIGYDDLDVYMEYGYVFVSSTGRNDVKMAAFSFKKPDLDNSFEYCKSLPVKRYLAWVTCTCILH